MDMLESKVNADQPKGKSWVNRLLLAGGLAIGIPAAVLIHDFSGHFIHRMNAKRACDYLYQEAHKRSITGVFEKAGMRYIVGTLDDGTLTLKLTYEGRNAKGVVYQDTDHDGNPESIVVIPKVGNMIPMEKNPGLVETYMDSLLLIAQKTYLESKIKKEGQPKYDV